jgi:tetratricopeptide (TPR) repeat protein
MNERSPQRVRDLFNKGFAALDRGNLDYAIDILFSCVMLDPEQLQARKYLRAAEIRKFRESRRSPVIDTLNEIIDFPLYLKGISALKKSDYSNALAISERLLKKAPLNLRYLKLFMDAVVGLNLIEAGIQTFELVKDQLPAVPQVYNWLGILYTKANRTKEAVACFERLCELTPTDPDAHRMLKQALALDSMTSDKWAQAGSYREVLKDEEEAITLERDAKAVKSEKELDAMIAEMQSKIQSAPRNLNYYRALARLYVQKKDFANALAILQKAVEINPGDPVLAKAIATTRLQQYDEEIARLLEAGEKEQAEAKKAERLQFAYNDLRERVQRYPNDLDLRYEWGLMLYETGDINGAIQQFQLSQRHPRHRTSSLYYLALCFKNKGQYDLAMQELEKAKEELSVMDETKKNICYELGTIAEILGDTAKAAEYYKQIYQSDISYKDVADKVERLYRQQ